MIFKLYSIKDKLVNFTGPIAFQDEKIAIRWFEAFCRKKKAEEYTESKYYDLYEIGAFDPEKGTLTALNQSELKLIKEGEQFDEQKD